MRGCWQRGAYFAALLAMGALACRPFGQAAETAQPLPQLPVYEIVPTPDSGGLTVSRLPAVGTRDPLARLRATRLVTITANNAEARTLLLWLAQEAGVNLVVAPDVTSRVSIHFADVPAGDAMRAIMAEAGLSVLMAPRQPNWPPVVFFQVPVNLSEATVEGIIDRFGVTLEMAQWIVETRP